MCAAADSIDDVDVLREHLLALCGRIDLLPGADQRVFIDIDSLLRPWRRICLPAILVCP